MKRVYKFTPAVAFLILSVAVTPAFAQRHSPSDRGAQPRAGGSARTDNGGGGQNRGAGQATERRAQPAAPAPRAVQPRAAAPPAARVELRDQRSQAVPRVSPRGESPRVNDRSRVIAPRTNDRSRIVTSRPYSGYVGRSFSRAYYSRPFYRPYYSFRPRVSIGFGLWLGYPVTYPYYAYDSYYPYDYGYDYGYNYGYPGQVYPQAPYYPQSGNVYPQTGNAYPPTGSVNIAPGAASGGVSFEISPATAAVYIDGEYAGIVSDFTPNMPPLSVTPGRHHFEIREPGFQTMAFDTDIIAGQVLPYQGTMQRY